MKPPTRVERQHVYLTYRELFSGKNALVRTKKDILGAIQASSTAKPLATQNPKRKTVSILRSLLEGHVFELEEQAKTEFPELWLEASEGDKDLTKCGSSHLIKLEDFEKTILPQASLQVTDPKEEISFPLNARPPRFSYKYQHLVLTTIQRMLEELCFNFTQTWLPAVIVQSAWTCAAAVELTKWLEIMSKHLESLPDDCIDASGRASFKEIRPRLALLRHSAVHRLPLEPDKLLEEIHAALMLAQILRDNTCTSKIQALHARLEDIIAQTKCDTEAMQNEVNHAYLAIQKQRKALDQQEQELRASAAEQISGISEAADLSLLDCAHILQDTNGQESEREQNFLCNERSVISDWDFCVGEDDIESDEDQLKADLG